jgi:hypothetical protein
MLAAEGAKNGCFSKSNSNTFRGIEGR